MVNWLGPAMAAINDWNAARALSEDELRKMAIAQAELVRQAPMLFTGAENWSPWRNIAPPAGWADWYAAGDDLQ